MTIYGKIFLLQVYLALEYCRILPFYVGCYTWISWWWSLFCLLCSYRKLLTTKIPTLSTKHFQDWNWLLVKYVVFLQKYWIYFLYFELKITRENICFYWCRDEALFSAVLVLNKCWVFNPLMTEAVII